MKKIIASIFSLVTLLSSAQIDFKNGEIGAEIFAGFSNFGGSVGGEMKYGVFLNEQLLVGPSFRLHQTWANNLGQKASFSVYGPGVFGHYRIQKVLFVGAEFQVLRNPFNFVTFQQDQLRKWSPNLMLGGGFCFTLNPRLKLNAAIFYDVINAPNSPFRTSYNFRIKNEFGQTVRILPIIYRVTFFFPLGQNNER
jgi:hypothetical protein